MQTDNLTKQHSIPYIGEGFSKKQIEQLAALSVEDVLERGNVFQVAEALAAIDQFADSVRKDPRFIDYLREELQKNNGKIMTASGAKIEACETSIKYDYSLNKEWVALDEEAKQLSDRKKLLEDRLKKIPAGLLLVDAETGEALIGAAKSSKSSYKVTLAR